MSFDLTNFLQQQASSSSVFVKTIELGEKSADDQREWLLTNGLGSFSSANIWGANTRRYHGLLLAALEPPVQRRCLLSRLDETINGQQLATNYWASGAVAPEGYQNLEGFAIYPCPTWVFKVKGGYLVKQVVMLNGIQSVYIAYTWQAQIPAQLKLDILLNDRDYHWVTKSSSGLNFKASQLDENSIKFKSNLSDNEIYLYFEQGSFESDTSWYQDYFYRREMERGLECTEDNLHCGQIIIDMEPGQTVLISASSCNDENSRLDNFQQVLGRLIGQQEELFLKASALLSKAKAEPALDLLKTLVLAASQFSVYRQSIDGPSIIAGYPWFADWGRDSMISLIGLSISCGQSDLAKGILETFSKYLSAGMLPNNFPDNGSVPAYNTIDATLWWAIALKRYFDRTGDQEFVLKQLPFLKDVIDWHIQGTRFNIKVSSEDGLLSGGQDGYALTWMDAKCGDYVVTPRMGKPVEINALWHNFLMVYIELSEKCAQAPDRNYARLAAMSKANFSKYFLEELDYLADVINTNDSADISLRPNQLAAIALPYPLLDKDKAKLVLARVEEKLLTPMGLRTLNQENSSYARSYGGGSIADQYHRDLTYHQGTVWPWLIGLWVDARFYCYGNSQENINYVKSKLSGLIEHIYSQGCLGSIAEIADGDSPHSPRGCLAQAWSVAELLRVFDYYEGLL